MTALERAEVKRDRYGRYLIPDPTTGKERAWTRATTLADTLDDRYNLELWKLRQCAIGLAMRKDLLALVAAHKADKQQLNKVCADALEAGKASEGANLGTALHALTEQLDRGEDALILDDLRADVDAYRAAMVASGFTIATLPDGRIAREVIVLCPELEVAGTADHILEAAGAWTIGDLKTGASAIDWAMGSISIQLAIYAHASHYFNPATNVLAELPARDTASAVVIHLPVGQGTCTLHDVDIAAGWEAAERALWVRGWRKRRGLSKPIPIDVTTAEQPDPFAGLAPTPSPSQIGEQHKAEVAQRREQPDMQAWLTERCQQIRDRGYDDDLKARWPARGVKLADMNDEQLAALHIIATAIEATHELPFIPGNPAARQTAEGWALDAATAALQAAFPGAEIVETGESADREAVGGDNASVPSPVSAPIDEGGIVPSTVVDDIERKRKALADAPRAWVGARVKEMAAAGQPLSLKANPTRRRATIASALIAWAGHIDIDGDAIPRAALAYVLGDDGVPNWGDYGATASLLTLEQADDLLDLAASLRMGDVRYDPEHLRIVPKANAA